MISRSRGSQFSLHVKRIMSLNTDLSWKDWDKQSLWVFGAQETWTSFWLGPKAHLVQLPLTPSGLPDESSEIKLPLVRPVWTDDPGFQLINQLTSSAKSFSTSSNTVKILLPPHLGSLLTQNSETQWCNFQPFHFLSTCTNKPESCVKQLFSLLVFFFYTSFEREEDIFNKREDSIVLDVAWLTESFLQLLLHIFFWVQQIDFWLLQQHRKDEVIIRCIC